MSKVIKNSTKAGKVLKTIESGAYPIIIGPQKGRLITELVKTIKPKMILEIGTNVGYSAITIAKAFPHTKIITIEIDPKNAAIARSNIKKAGLEKEIDVTLGDANNLIPALSGKFDLMFIDAVKEEYLHYLKLAEANLAMGAVVISDNVKIFQEQMQDYLEYVRYSGKYKSKTYNVGYDAIEVSIKF